MIDNTEDLANMLVRQFTATDNSFSDDDFDNLCDLLEDVGLKPRPRYEPAGLSRENTLRAVSTLQTFLGETGRIPPSLPETAAGKVLLRFIQRERHRAKANLDALTLHLAELKQAYHATWYTAFADLVRAEVGEEQYRKWTSAVNDKLGSR